MDVQPENFTSNQHEFVTHLSFSLSSKQTQMAAMRVRSTFGATVTKYCAAPEHVSGKKSFRKWSKTPSSGTLTVSLSAKISLTLKKLRDICATGCPPQVMLAERSNQSPFTSISTWRLSDALVNSTWDLEPITMALSTQEDFTFCNYDVHKQHGRTPAEESRSRKVDYQN